jgi:hypothetical protein
MNVSKTKLNINSRAWVSGQPGRKGHLIMFFFRTLGNLTNSFLKSQIPGGSPEGGGGDQSWN